jgi:Asp-tRNA(Asn)/Glu-tRNA(Gln) amidotransferase C subunit
MNPTLSLAGEESAAAEVRQMLQEMDTLEGSLDQMQKANQHHLERLQRKVALIRKFREDVGG